MKNSLQYLALMVLGFGLLSIFLSAPVIYNSDLNKLIQLPLFIYEGLLYWPIVMPLSYFLLIRFGFKPYPPTSLFHLFVLTMISIANLFQIALNSGYYNLNSFLQLVMLKK